MKRSNVRSTDQQTIKHIKYQNLDQHIKSQINKSKTRSTDQKSEQQKKLSDQQIKFWINRSNAKSADQKYFNEDKVRATD